MGPKSVTDLRYISKWIKWLNVLHGIGSWKKLEQSKKWLLNVHLACDFVAGAGSILAMVQAASQRDPDIICGKPYKPTFDVLVSKYNIDPQKTLMIGDRSVLLNLYLFNVSLS